MRNWLEPKLGLRAGLLSQSNEDGSSEKTAALSEGQAHERAGMQAGELLGTVDEDGDGGRVHGGLPSGAHLSKPPGGWGGPACPMVVTGRVSRALVLVALLLVACSLAVAPSTAPEATPTAMPAAAGSIGSFRAIGQPFADLGLVCASSPLTNGQPRVICTIPTQPGAMVELIATPTSQGQLLASLAILFDPTASDAEATAALQLFMTDADAIANQQASVWMNPLVATYTNANTETKTLISGTFGTVELHFTGIAGAVLLAIRVPPA